MTNDYCDVCGCSEGHKQFCTHEKRLREHIENQPGYDDCADGYVYVLILDTDYGVFPYVGQTKDFKQRYYAHRTKYSEISLPVSGPYLSIMERSTEYEIVEIDSVDSYNQTKGMADDTFNKWLQHEERAKYLELAEEGDKPLGGR